MERIKKISKYEHDFFMQYENYKFEKTHYLFADYSNDVKKEIEKLKSKGFSNCDISVRYFFSTNDFPSIKDKPDEGIEQRLLTVVDILDNSGIIYSRSLYYDLTYYKNKHSISLYNTEYGYHSLVYKFKNLKDLSKEEMKNENLLITNLNNHINKLYSRYDYRNFERTFIFNKIQNWVNAFLR